MSDVLKKAAEILVECGYATSFFAINKDSHYWIRFKGTDKEHTHVDPFADALDGRRQADAIEDWLCIYQYPLWNSSDTKAEYPEKTDTSFWHLWRINKIKWCLEQLSSDS